MHHTARRRKRALLPCEAGHWGACGFTAPQMGLLECDDSSGEFGDAIRRACVDDLETAAQWLQTAPSARPWSGRAP